jgi:4'-phosphopantetheinyl transferase
MALDRHRRTAHAVLRLWCVDLDVREQAEAGLRGELSPGEIARAERFASPRVRRRFVVARGTLRALLGFLLEERPRSVPIAEGSSGKPRLAEPEPRLHFNVSHSGDLALVCVADGLEVGVDLESVRPVPSAVAIARRCFTPAEASFVEDGAQEDVDRRFLRCWTRKEALVKALGTGLDRDLRNFSVPLTPAGGIALIEGSDGGSPPGPWLLVDVPLGPEHVAAAALPASVVGGGIDPSATPARVELDSRLEHCEEIDVWELIARAASSRMRTEGARR